MVRLVTDRFQLDIEAVRLQLHGGAADGQLADAALPQASADHDALCILPVLQSQESADDLREFLGELLDRALDDARGLGIPLREDLVELLLADFLGGRVAEGVFPRLPDPLAPVIDNRDEGPPARAVADESFRAAQLGIVRVDRDLAELLGAVGDQRIGCCIRHALGNGGAGLWFLVALEMKRVLTYGPI